MSLTWQSEEDGPAPARPRGLGWALVGLRLLPILLVLGFGLCLTLLLRLIEAPLWRDRRPLTPWITVAVCRLVLRCLGLGWRVVGRAAPQAGLLVANHVSWLDIFALNAVRPMYFVAKSEVAGWPGISWLARATGTIFIARDPRRSQAQAAMLGARLRAGQRLLLFPEGTSSDGLRVLRFRSAMFAAVAAMPEGQQIQPITLAYRAPEGADPRFYGWWGDMDLGPSLLQVLAARPQGGVAVIHHSPLGRAALDGRKALAAACEEAVREGLQSAQPVAQYPASPAGAERAEP